MSWMRALVLKVETHSVEEAKERQPGRHRGICSPNRDAACAALSLTVTTKEDEASGNPGRFVANVLLSPLGILTI